MASVVTNFQARSLRLIAIANELLTIAKQIEGDDAGHGLAVLGHNGSGHNGSGVNGQHPERVGQALGESQTINGDHPLWAELAREHYRSRRRRDKIFQTNTLFGEPAWDILLDLFIAAKEGRRVSVMSACIGASVPSTTALRWITALEKEGLLLREDDPVDARRTFVQLSPVGYTAMVDYFASAAKTIKATALARLDEFERAERAAEAGELFARDDFENPSARRVGRG